jgi:hypothetical protein
VRTWGFKSPLAHIPAKHITAGRAPFERAG